MFVTSDLFAQKQSSNSPISISAHVGAFKNQEKYYKLQYDTDIFPSYGLEFHLPLNKISGSFGFMGKITWMSATGVPLIYSLDGVRRYEEEKTKLLKRVSNLGIKINPPIRRNIRMNIVGGVIHVFKKHTNVDRNSEDKDSLWQGFFGGLGIEYIFEEAPVSLTSNVIYNHTYSELRGLFGNNGGLHMSLGLRYYLPFEI